MILTVQVVMGWGRRGAPREHGYSCPRSTGAGMPAWAGVRPVRLVVSRYGQRVAAPSRVHRGTFLPSKEMAFNSRKFG